MNRTIYIVWVLALTVPPIVGATGCATRMLGERFDDARITGRVNRRLLRDPDVDRFRIDADTLDRVVTLRGEVDSEKMAEKAVRTAYDTTGVRRVENQLVVDPPDDDDGDLGTRFRVGWRLRRAPDIDRRNIDVDVQDGVVTLSGIVHDENAKILAENVARSTEGVGEVRNELTVNHDDQMFMDEHELKQGEAPPTMTEGEYEVEEPVTDEPVTDEPVTDEPMTDEPFDDEPFIDDEPITDEPTSSVP